MPQARDDSVHEEREFDGLERDALAFAGASFVACTFRDCDLSEVSMRGTHLSECVFEGCELGMVDLTDATLHWATFERCRMTGVDLGSVRRDAVGIQIAFAGCDLTLASFRDLDLRGCSVRDCVARDADFEGCDLREVALTGTDFAGATFRRNDLRGADLRRARNYLIGATANDVRDLQVELPEAIGLLAALQVRVVG